MNESTVGHPMDLPNTIQPHGLLLVLNESDLRIVQVSSNAEAHLGLSPQVLVGSSLDALVAPSQLPTLLQNILLVQEQVIPIKLAIETGNGPSYFDSFIHRTNTAIILELEPSLSTEPESVLAINALVRETILQIQDASTHADLLAVTVNNVQALTQYDRVLVYQFDAQGGGEVIAEAKHTDLPPYIGLHFPAHDIPAWVRQLYRQGQMRAIPDMQADTVSLLPDDLASRQEPLDLRLSVLRSPNACCVEYYRNMGMAATLVISLLKDHNLWGLLTCHHATPKPLSYNVRASCELLAQMATSELVSKIRQQDLAQQARCHALQSKLLTSIAQADNFIEALIKPKENLLELVNAAGAAICLGADLTLVGQTPTSTQVKSLIDWIDTTISDTLFHTNRLSHLHPDSLEFKDVVSGLLVLRLSKVQRYQILWFRPEVIQTVDWGGRPTVETRTDEQGEVRLCPRSSFERWQEMVYGTSLPWQPFEIRGAKDLRNAIVGIVLKKADELTHLNLELQRSNRELTSFAYAAAHDLKEPLRGIYNYASILQEDYGLVLDEEGVEYLTEIQRFSQRMETLINALLRISQLRQATLQIQSIDLNELLQKIVEVLYASQPSIDFELRVPRRLPTLQCDPILVSEVFRNLLSNAIKYNDQSEKWVEVGYQTEPESTQTSGIVLAPELDSELTTELDSELTTELDSALPLESSLNKPDSPIAPITFYVKDNGIGIREEHLTLVFKLFKRLHPQDCYGGGTGVGLAVVEQIIERHEGHIWVESVLGEGSTFYFVLGSA